MTWRIQITLWCFAPPTPFIYGGNWAKLKTFFLLILTVAQIKPWTPWKDGSVCVCSVVCNWEVLLGSIFVKRRSFLNFKVPINLGLLVQNLQLAACCFTEDEARQPLVTIRDMISLWLWVKNTILYNSSTGQVWRWMEEKTGSEEVCWTFALTLMVICVPSSAQAVSQLEMDLSLCVHA